MTEVTDGDAVARVLAGDREAFGVLVSRHRTRGLRYAYHLLGNAQDAEDAVQESFLRAYRALGRLIALSEAYPDLKANANFQQLQSELSDIENKLAAARRFFNNAVSEYNTGIQQFPAVLFAGMFGFAHRDFFDVGVEDRKTLDVAPQVKFGA